MLGKPIGITAASWLASRPAVHGPRSPLSPPLLLAAGAFAGIGFTVSVLIASLAFSGERLEEAKLGALATVRARAAGRLGGAAGRQTAARQRARAPDRGHCRRHPRSLPGCRSRARSHSRRRGRARDARRVRRLRVSLLRAGRAGHPRAARVLRPGRPLRLAPAPAQRRAPERTAGRRSLGGGVARRATSGRCTTPCWRTRANCAPRT